MTGKSKEIDLEALWECRDPLEILEAFVAYERLRSREAHRFFTEKLSQTEDPEVSERAQGFLEILATLAGKRETLRSNLISELGDFPASMFALIRLFIELQAQLGRGGNVQQLDLILRIISAIKSHDEWVRTDGRFKGQTLHQETRFCIILYWTLGEVDILDTAILSGNTSLVLPCDSKWYPLRLLDLAVANHARYLALKDPQDLKKAIEYLEKALQHTTSKEIQANLRTNLSAGYFEIYRLNGDLTSLESSISCCRSALESISALIPDDQARLLNNYGNVMLDRFKLFHDQKDLEEAVRASKLSVDATPKTSPELGRNLDNYGSACITFASTKKKGPKRIELMESGINIKWHALQNCEAGVEFARIGCSLGGALIELASETGKSYYLDQAIKFLNSLVDDSTCKGSTYEAQARITLALALIKRGDSTDGLLTRVHELFEGIDFHSASIPSMLRFEAADLRSSLLMANGEWSEASAELEIAVELLHENVFAHGDRSHQEAWLRLNENSVGSKLAYSLAQQKDPEEAVLAFDRSQAILLSLALEDFSSSFPDSNAHPELADYQNALSHWKQAVGVSSPDDLKALSKLWDNLEGARKRLASNVVWTDLHATATQTALPRALRDGPVIQIGHTSMGGFALVSRARDRPEIIWLPKLISRDIEEHVYSLHTAMAAVGDDQGLLHQAIESAIIWLEEVLLSDLMSMIFLGFPLIMTDGLLGRLPLRAACFAVSSEGAAVRSLRQVPNLRIFSKDPPPLLTDKKSLLVIKPDTGDTTDILPLADLEASVLKSFLPNCILLSNKEASRERILSELPGCEIAHFSCHGLSDPIAPLEKCGLWVSPGELLNLKELLDADFSNMRLVVLSACETALPGTVLPDEVVSLPTGILQAGAQGVIGTLWPVADVSAFLLLVRFFSLWPEGGGHPAKALTDAQDWLRQVTVRELGDFVTMLKKRTDTDIKLPTFDKWTSDEIPFSHPFHWGGFAYYGA
ncbi:MAG: CHAT domain-containing protein [Deltaproteobacteria bacterium]|nr:CHAT domain-containing protein [Deltaproteobacteria bacterium]